MNDTPIINLRGEKIALGPLSRELLPLFVKWMNDFDVTRILTRAGFQDIGCRRGVVWQSGRCIDMLYMDCIAPEYFAANP